MHKTPKGFFLITTLNIYTVFEDLTYLSEESDGGTSLNISDYYYSSGFLLSHDAFMFGLSDSHYPGGMSNLLTMNLPVTAVTLRIEYIYFNIGNVGDACGMSKCNAEDNYDQFSIKNDDICIYGCSGGNAPLVMAMTFNITSNSTSISYSLKEQSVNEKQFGFLLYYEGKREV
mgnify:CR=1 FL=1